MKKITVFVLALVLMLALALASAHALTNLDQYASASFTKSFAVYSGPGQDYYRANNGKALYGGSGGVRIYGVAGQWVMIGYGLSNGDYRIGYVEKDALNYMKNLKGTINYNLTFSTEVMYIKSAVFVTDDPVVKNNSFTTLPANTQVTALGQMGSWAYIECWQNSQKMRGFVWAHNLTDAHGGTLAPQATALPALPLPTLAPYPVVPTAAPSYTGNTLLASLKHNCPNTGIMLPETFSPYQTTYLLTVADWVSRPTFTPVAYDQNAVITVNGQTIRSGQTYNAPTMTDKPQQVTITVTNGGASTTYTIYLQRRPSEKRTRVSAGYIKDVYLKNNTWRIHADLGTISYLADDYSTGSRSTFTNKTVDKYDYAVSPNCLFYYGTPTNMIRVHTVQEFMTYYQAYGSNLYTIIYIEDEIVAVMPYGAEPEYTY